MAAIKAAQAAHFLKSPPPSTTAVLLFGTDAGQVTERAQHLAKLLTERETPPGEILRLDDTDLEDDSERLTIELQTRPMFSGRKIVRATAGRRINAAALKPLIESQTLEGLLIVEAGNLKADDALRSLFEKSPSAAAIGCYPDTDADLDTLIAEVLAEFGLRISADARSLLISRLGADRALSRAEIEKLALYCGGRASVEADDVDQIVGDAADLALERIAEAAADGRAGAAVADYGRVIASGESAQAVIAVAQRYFIKLHRLRSDVDGGQSVDEALRLLRPPVHFKQRDALASQVRRWNSARLDAALKRIADAAKTARRQSAIEDTIAERLLLALSALAGGEPQRAAGRR